MTQPKITPECEVLHQVRVRLIVEEERARFDELLERDHYLHSARLGGQSLRYVAEVGGQWVALIAFSGAAPHTKAREQKIRWTPRQRARRLAFVVNNSRFLVLPERRLARALGPPRDPGGELRGREPISGDLLSGLRLRGGGADRRLWPEQPGLLPGARAAQAALLAGTAAQGDEHSAPRAAACRSGRARGKSQRTLPVAR